MVAPIAAVCVVVVPVASPATAVMVRTPVAAMPIVVVPSVMPLPVIAVALLPLPTLPVAMAIVVSVAIPARTDDNLGRRFGIHRRRRSVDRLGRIRDTGDANVYSDIDVCERDGRCAYAKASNQCHREPATA